MRSQVAKKMYDDKFVELLQPLIGTEGIPAFGLFGNAILVPDRRTERKWEWNLATDEVVFGSAWLEKYKRSSQSASHSFRWKELIHPSALQDVLDGWRKISEGLETSYSCIYGIKNSEKEWVPVMSEAIAGVKSPKGKVLTIKGVHVEITQVYELPDIPTNLNDYTSFLEEGLLAPYS